jgi:hypothetical protein
MTVYEYPQASLLNETCLEYYLPVDASILRVRFFSQTSVHSTARFVLHYSVDLPDPSVPCSGLSPSDAWHHISAVVDVSEPAYARLSLYLNGSLVATSVEPLVSASGLAISGEMGLAIGRADTARPPPWIGVVVSNDLQALHRGADSFWFGGLDEIRIWNQSLTELHISASFNTSCAWPGDPRWNLSGPLVCFGFEDSLEGRTATEAGFRDAGIEGGAMLVPVAGDKHMAWCETRGDQGQLMSQFSSASISTANSNRQSWGFCSDRPRVPGLGFNYLESALQQARVTNVKKLAQVPGCGEVPVIFWANRAEK